jgi:hypothetical protein
MIETAFLDDLRARVPVSKVVGLRIKLRKAGREWKGLSPFNAERSPSFFVNDKKGFWHDFSSGRHGDIFAFVMETEGADFRAAVGRVAAIAGMGPPDDVPVSAPAPAPATKPPERPAQDHTKRLALEIWKAAGDLGGTPAAMYLTGRKLVLPEGVSGRALRFHPRCPWRNDADELVKVPALIALFRDIHSDEPKAVLRRALTADGRKLGKPRSLGSMAGCAIKLSADDAVEQGLHIGEGVESTLGAMMLGYQPAWALGGTAGIQNFPILAGIDCLTIITDADASGAGQRAAAECCQRWAEAGRETISLIPDRIAADFNDVLEEGAA